MDVNRKIERVNLAPNKEKLIKLNYEHLQKFADISEKTC